MAEDAVKALSALVGDLSPERPLVLVEEVFQKGGYKTSPCNYDSRQILEYMAIYPERVIRKIVFTPDAAGVLANITESITSADGTPPVLVSLLDDDSVVNVPEEDWPDLCADEEAYESEYETNLSEWLEAQLDVATHAEESGYTFVGKYSLNGQRSVRYENRSRVSLGVIEFVEVNSLLVQQSWYTVLADGTLVLDSQTTTMSWSAGEPTAAPGGGTGEGG